MNGIPYIIQVQLCIAAFWLVYRLFMRGGGTFAHNRAYLLGMMAPAFVIPALSIPLWPAEAAAGGTFDLGALQAFVVEARPEPGLDWRQAALWIALAGSGAMLAGVGLTLWRMARTVRRGAIVHSAGVRIVSAEAVRSPYSFFRSIFVHPQVDPADDLPRIVAHEMAHVRLGHSYDAVFAQAMLVAFWWNPLVWLWSRSLKEVHEYQADNAVLNLGFDAKQYITLLIGTFADQHPEFVSGFRHSLLKNRLIMMTKPQHRRSGSRILAAAPVAALLMGLFAFTEKSPAPAGIPMDMQAVVSQQIDVQQQTAAPQPPASGDEPFMRVENMPKFEGGNEAAFRNWVMMQLRYPAEAASKGIQGPVVVKFVVERDGSVSSAEAIQSPDASLGAEAVRVVSSSPKWTPGTQGGEAVRVAFVLPVAFNLPRTEGEILAVSGEGGRLTGTFENGQLTGTFSHRSDAAEGDPLTVLDGERMPSGFNVNVIDPDKIDRITVLKDAAATAQYGEDAKDGVIVIMTKPGTQDEGVRVIGYGAQRRSGSSETALQDGRKIINMIQVRGNADGTDPLVIVDGEVMSADFQMNSITPASIERVEVLKDASATAPYGEAGRNGVILITTKSN